MRNRILKTLALASCLFATNAVAQTTGAVVSISSAPTVGGACYTGMAVYVHQSTGDHYTCIGGVWVKLAISGGGNADWVKKGIDVDADGTSPIALKYNPANENILIDLDQDGSHDMEFQTTSMVPYFYMGPVSAPRSYWYPEGFVGFGGALKISATNKLEMTPDADNSGGDNMVELKTAWTGGNTYPTFRFSGTTLTFEGAADDANQVDFTPATLTGTRTVTVPDKSGGLVLLNGTTYPTVQGCAEWNTSGLLTSTGSACGSGGSGDDITIDGVNAGGAGNAVQFGKASGGASTGDIDFFFTDATAPNPDIVEGTIFTGVVNSNKITDNTITFNDLNNIVFTDPGTSKLIDMSAVNMSVTNEGLRIPSSTDCQQSASTYSEGTICWESDTNILWVADGDTQPNDWTQVGGGGDVTDVFDCTGPDCNVITMTSGDSLRANTAGVIGLQESSVNMTDGTTACSAAQIGDIRVDFVGDPNNPELYVCTETAPGFWWFQLFSGVVGQTGVETREDGGPGNTGQGVLDFKSGFDITPASGGVTEIRFDISELTLTHDTLPTPDEYGIWMSGALTDATPAVCPPDTEDTVIQIPIPVCYGPNEKLSFHPAVDMSGCADDVEAYWTCDGFSASSVAMSVDVDGVTVGDGVDPEIWVSDSGNAVYFNPAGGTGVANWEWRMTNSGTVNILEPRTHVNSEVRACAFTQYPTTECDPGLLGVDEDSDGSRDAWIDLDATGLKLYVGEGSTTPTMALVTGGIDANNDGIADNLSTNGLNKSMPNYNKSFTGETTVVMDDHYLGTDNLVTVCYDGSNNQISPTSVSIGTSPLYAVTATFSGSTTGRCVINGGANSRYVTSFSNQVSITITQASVGVDPYAARVMCYDDADPRNLVEPDSIQIDDATLDMTINFAVGQSGRCTVS